MVGLINLELGKVCVLPSPVGMRENGVMAGPFGGLVTS